MTAAEQPIPQDDRIAGPANAFGPAAGDYERARPTYPPEAIALLRTHLGVGPGGRVLDLAAGTGKLTRLLVAAGAAVTAVEPVPGMREQLVAAVPGVAVLDGTAEAIPFDDGSFDVVTVAQAFHWFRFDEALVEIRRVLRPGGGLAIVFNERDGREPWVGQWNEVIDWHARTIARYQATDWTAVLAGGGFGGVGSEVVEWSETMDRDRLAGRVRSVSYIAELPAAEQQVLVDRVLAIVGRFPETFPVPYRTHVWWARRP